MAKNRRTTYFWTVLILQHKRIIILHAIAIAKLITCVNYTMRNDGGIAFFPFMWGSSFNYL